MVFDHGVVDVEGKESPYELQKSRRVLRIEETVSVETANIPVYEALGSG